MQNTTTARIAADATFIRLRCIRCKTARDITPETARGFSNFIGAKLGSKVSFECQSGDCRERAMAHANSTYDIDIAWIAAAK